MKNIRFYGSAPGAAPMPGTAAGAGRRPWAPAPGGGLDAGSAPATVAIRGVNQQKVWLFLALIL